MNVFEGGLCLDKGRKAAVLFPKYSEIPEWYTREVENLTEAQLEYGNKSIDWMKWDIRYQVSHVAYVHFFWLIVQRTIADLMRKLINRWVNFYANCVKGWT